MPQPCARQILVREKMMNEYTLCIILTLKNILSLNYLGIAMGSGTEVRVKVWVSCLKHLTCIHHLQSFP